MIRNTIKIVLFVCLLFPVVNFTRAPAAEKDLLPFEKTKGPWHIKADVIRHIKARQLFIAQGDVVITRKHLEIRADEIRFDRKEQVITAEGNVFMASRGDTVSGKRVVMDMDAETGQIDQGRIFFKDKHFYITGQHIEKLGENKYRARRVRVTTCDPDNPDWQITGRDLKLEVEGYGTLYDAALRVKDVPVLYTPYLFFPVKIKRQSGFLIPEMGYSNEKGAEYLQPYYWVINDSADMTFYAHHMGLRGEKVGAEYRQVFGEDSRVTLMYDYFHDEKVNDEPDDEYAYGGDDYLRPNDDRYWFRMKQDQKLGYGISAQLDLDIVSDQDYLQEFEEGYTGFDAADEYFESEFGRDLDDNTDDTRENRLNFYKGWDQYGLNAELRWYDDIIKRRWEDTDDTAQRLPEIQFNALKQPLFESPLYYQLDSEYVYCWREDGVKGHRADIHPTLFWPLHFEPFLYVEPSVGFRETTWWIETYDGRMSTSDKKKSRAMYNLNLEVSSELYRVFSFGQKNSSKLKHTMIPEIAYEYVPYEDQKRYPVFDDDLDVIEEENKVTYSLTNTFTLRQKKKGKNGDSKKPNYRYNRLCRFKIWQSYDIGEARDDDGADQDSHVDWENREERRPFSPIEAELDINLFSWWRLDADAAWDVYENQFVTYNAASVFKNNRGDRLRLEYRYDRDVVESIYLESKVVLNDAFNAYAIHECTLEGEDTDSEEEDDDNIDIETGFGIEYKSGCWSIQVGYLQEADEHSYTFMVNLYGLGEVGSPVVEDETNHFR